MLKSSMKSKYISHGSYGCVFEPAQPCSTNGTKNKKTATKKALVSKVFWHASDAGVEAERSREIASYDKDGLFTVRMYGQCPVRRNQFTSKDFQKCGRHFANRRRKLFEQIVYESGGKDLEYDEKKYSGYFGKCTFRELFHALEPIFAGLITLKRENVVHYDIKTMNIIYNPDTKRMKLIDFGLSTPLDTFYESEQLATEVYEFYPADASLYWAMQTRYKQLQSILLNHSNEEIMASEEMIQNLQLDGLLQNYSEFTTNQQDFQRMLFEFPNKWRVDGGVLEVGRQRYEVLNFLRALLTTSKLMSVAARKKYIIDIFTILATRFDTYSLGIVVLELLLAFFTADRIDLKGLELKMVVRLITSLITMNPLKRATPEKALQSYKRIINVLDVRDRRQIV